MLLDDICRRATQDPRAFIEKSEAEFRENRRYRFRMAAGLIDFLSVVAGAVVILLMGALLVNMITWLQSDFDQMFTLLRRNL